MSKRILAVLLLLTILAPDVASAKGKAKVIRLDAEAERALARLGALSLAAVRARLTAMRPAAYLPGAVLPNTIIARQQLPVVTGSRVERLQAAIKPVLAYHQREQMPVIVVYSDQPRAALIACAVIVITTKLMAITSDAEMRGIIAHELAHEYVWEERKRAAQSEDESSVGAASDTCRSYGAGEWWLTATINMPRRWR